MSGENNIDAKLLMHEMIADVHEVNKNIPH